MKTHSALDTYQDDAHGLDAINRRLNDIQIYLQQEMTLRQNMIFQQEEQIDKLKAVSAKKDTEILTLKDQLQQCVHSHEGTRQLINKLLNDIDKYRKDLEWYQRTYETRSLPGAIWQKIFRNSKR